MSTSSPTPPPGIGRRRSRLLRLVCVAAIASSLVAGASACVGQTGRNDDHVGPTSLRPDARPRS